MLYILWFLSLLAAGFLGYKLGDLTKKMKAIEESVRQKIDRPVETEPQSMIIDELDEVQVAMAEHDKMMERLNPHD